MPRRKLGGHISCSRECKKMWRNEPSHSQVNSYFGSWSSNGLPNLQRAIVSVKIHWIKKFFDIIKKLLKRRCLNWLAWPIWTSKTEVWPKERPGVKLAIKLLTTKSQESTRFPYVQVTCDIPLESSQQRLQFCFKLHLNQRSSHKVMGPQNHRNPNLGNFGTPIWESWDKMSFGCGPRGEA